MKALSGFRGLIGLSGPRGKVCDFTEVDINVKGAVNGLHAAFPYLRSTPGSVAVNLASASAIYGQAELANSSATRFFVRGIIEALDLEWGKYGIRVIAISRCPCAPGCSSTSAPELRGRWASG